MARVPIGGMKVAIGRQAVPGTGTFNFTYLAGLDQVDLPNSVADDIEITDQDSPGQREYQRGFIDNGSVTFSGVKWIPGSVTDTLLKALKASGETVHIRFDITEDDSETYEGYLKSYVRNAPVTEKRTCDAEFKISAMVVEAA